MDIPVLDFADFAHGSQAQQDGFCQKLHASLSTLGFVKIRNHSIPDETLDEVFEWSKKFFDLPLEDKLQAAHPVQANPHRGWSCVGQEKLSVIRQGKAVFDLKESFDQGPQSDPLYPNIFPPPTTLPHFRPFMERFYESCQTLHLHLLTALALSFSLPPTFFTARCSRNSSELRLNHYPPATCAADLDALADGSMMRISSHTDFGTVTLLFQDGVGGLEVEDQDRSGVYIPVLPTARSGSGDGDEGGEGGRVGRELIVNVGDCLQRWTNDRLRSANHRVTLPVGMKTKGGSSAGSGSRSWSGSGAAAGGSSSNGGTFHTHEVPRRYSVAYFGKPDREALVGAIPELVRDGEQVKYGGTMTAWEYNQSRLLQTY
ncbi:hypothetical protein BJX68DRAFT_108509 [Aspergillus pseudodeflectus]|uniref:Fe2OG dioxygenase domain-containing protein n=1 Tax=Aspergillus pseudodeflectus TaxID=176178 RepID=A0ABR4K5M2_9EURO